MFNITCITTNEQGISVFAEMSYAKNARGGMVLSDQIAAKNFRLRESKAGYSTDWHLAGDPTLLIIQKGTLRISLQSGAYKDFQSGEMLIAADALPENIAFDCSIHGHKAAVIGAEDLVAVHIKLDNWKLG